LCRVVACALTPKPYLDCTAVELTTICYCTLTDSFVLVIRSAVSAVGVASDEHRERTGAGGRAVQALVGIHTIRYFV
jgi:hypothetical protein